nr:MAG TPA: hypothetical protein [Caudoviricetes sp.]
MVPVWNPRGTRWLVRTGRSDHQRKSPHLWAFISPRAAAPLRILLCLLTVWSVSC